MDIPFEKIHLMPNQPRLTYNEENIAKLAQTIRKNGFKGNIVVWEPKPGYYEIISGHRRYLACLRVKDEIGMSSMPCDVYENITEKDAYRMAVLYNEEREDLTLTELAESWRRLRDDYGESVDKIAEDFHTSKSTVLNTISVLREPKEIQNMVNDRKLTLIDVLYLRQIKDNDLKLKTARKLISGEIPKTKLPDYVKSLQRRQKVISLIPSLEGDFAEKETKKRGMRMEVYIPSDFKLYFTFGAGQRINWELLPQRNILVSGYHVLHRSGKLPMVVDMVEKRDKMDHLMIDSAGIVAMGRGDMDWFNRQSELVEFANAVDADVVSHLDVLTKKHLLEKCKLTVREAQKITIRNAEEMLDLKTKARKCFVLQGNTDEEYEENIKAYDELGIFNIDNNIIGIGCQPIGEYVYNDTVEPIESASAVHNMSRWHVGDMITIKAQNLPPVKFTPNHPIYANGKWVRADELSIGDVLTVPKFPVFKEKTYIDLTPHCNGCTKQKKQKHLITKDIAYLLGFFAAEGWTTVGWRHKEKTDANKIYRVCISQNNLNHEHRICKTLDKMGINYSISKSSKPNKTLTIISKPLYMWLRENIGVGSTKKKIPKCIMNASPDVIISFLKGYLDGDGNYQPKKKHNAIFQATTTSKELMHGFFLACFKCGVKPCFRGTREHEDHYHTEYYFGINGKLDVEAILNETPREPREYKLPIKSIKREPFEGFVYDIETENHTYNAPFIVHNSRAGERRNITIARYKYVCSRIKEINPKLGIHAFGIGTPYTLVKLHGFGVTQADNATPDVITRTNQWIDARTGEVAKGVRLCDARISAMYESQLLWNYASYWMGLNNAFHNDKFINP